MGVEVVMKRAPRPGARNDMNMVLRELRQLAMNQPGYTTGETLLSATDQGTTLVISSWAAVKDWKAHENSSLRKDILDNLEPLLSQPAATEIWLESQVVG